MAAMDPGLDDFRRESGRQIKRVVKDLPEFAPQHSSKPRAQLSESLKACNEILKEVLGKKTRKLCLAVLQTCRYLLAGIKRLQKGR